MNNSRDVINFAERVLTLLDQGKFTSTYKYAVLLALMDLSMERFSEVGLAPESVTTRQLSEKIVQLYWLHTNPFDVDDSEHRILLQNSGRQGAQATILRDIAAFRNQTKLGYLAPYFAAKYADKVAFRRLLDSVEWTLISMPLPRLQRMGATERNFIYTICWDKDVKKGTVNNYQRGRSQIFDNLIRFQPGVSNYFIQLNGLLRPLIQREWALRVAETNRLEEARLQQFLFRTNRTPTKKINMQLAELQDEYCFYCRQKLGTKGRLKPEVDHFVPWARYPNDTLANFVVAHSHCNGNKRDFLASELHLESWNERLQDAEVITQLNIIAQSNSWDVGRNKSHSVCKAIYLNLQDEVELWQESQIFTPVRKEHITKIFGMAG